MSVKRTFRLADDNADKLRRLAEERGVTATEIINAAISEYGSAPYDCHTAPYDEPDGNVERDLRFHDETLAILKEQLERKDEQIASLTDALRSAQDTAKAAQALHAVSESKALESTDQKRSRWRRLVDAWRG